MRGMPQKIKTVKIENIYPNPYQTRRIFERGGIERLTESVRKHGLLCPVILRTCARGYEIVCGQRRVRAAQSAGLKEIPAFVINISDSGCALLSVIENTCRENLTFQEEAEGYFNLLSYHRIKKDKLSEETGRETSEINEKIRILSLCEEIRRTSEEYKLPQKYMTELLKIHDEQKQLEIIEKTVQEDRNYIQLCEMVKKELSDMKKDISTEKKKKRIRKKSFSMPLFLNTVEDTVKTLRENGAEVETVTTDNDKYVEITLKLSKI